MILECQYNITATENLVVHSQKISQRKPNKDDDTVFLSHKKVIVPVTDKKDFCLCLQGVMQDLQILVMPQGYITQCPDLNRSKYV